MPGQHNRRAAATSLPPTKLDPPQPWARHWRNGPGRDRVHPSAEQGLDQRDRLRTEDEFSNDRDRASS